MRNQLHAFRLERGLRPLRHFGNLYARDARPSPPAKPLLLPAFYAGRNGSRWSSSTTICRSTGSSDWPLMIRSEMPSCSARTAIACSAAMSRRSCYKGKLAATFRHRVRPKGCPLVTAGWTLRPRSKLQRAGANGLSASVEAPWRCAPDARPEPALPLAAVFSPAGLLPELRVC